MTEHTHPEIIKLTGDVGEIIDILQGPEQIGGVRNGGLVADVTEMKYVLSNGVDATLSIPQKVAITAAGIGGLASVLSAWILT